MSETITVTAVCWHCQGTGTIKRATSKGATWNAVCPTCHGTCEPERTDGRHLHLVRPAA